MTTEPRLRLVPAFIRVVIEPALWITAIRVIWSIRRRGWWRQRPFLPVPSADYVAFRMETQYGNDIAMTSRGPADVLEYLRWVRQWRRGT